MDASSLLGTPVELTASDGRTFRFRIAALVPFEDIPYAVLEGDSGVQQWLVTRVETDKNGGLAFPVEGDEAVITGVLEKLTALTISRTLEKDPDDDALEDMDEEDADCCRDHGHCEEDPCDCGCNHNLDDCQADAWDCDRADCRADNRGCDCHHDCHESDAHRHPHSSHRPLPSYIKHV